MNKKFTSPNLFPREKDSSFNIQATIRKLKRKQIAQGVILLLAGIFIVGSMTSAKVKTLKSVKKGSIKSAYLAKNSVNSSKIKNGEVKNADLDNDSVTSGKIADGEVSSSDLADSSITTDKIADGNVNTNDIANNSITSGKIADGEVFNSDLAAGAVNSSKVLDGSITAEDIKDSTITAAKMADGVITGSASSVWGSITGTLSSQTDLQNALNEKASRNEITVGDSGYGSTFAEAVTAISSTPTTLVVPDGTHEGGGVTVPANVTLKVLRGALLHEADGTTLTINGNLDTGLYQVFSWSGSGAVVFGSGAVKEVYPQWWGAKGDGTTDDSAALTAASAACHEGGSIYLAEGVYKTSGWLISKTLSIVSDTPISYNGSGAATIKAAGAQSYVLKFGGTYSGDSNPSGFLHPYLRNINVDGDNKAISDAAFIMENCNFASIEGSGFQNANGHGVRLRTCWEIRFRDFWLNNCGTIDTGSAFFIDGPSPFNAAYGTNNLRLDGGIWSSNRGRWIDMSSLANLDATWIEGNKFELDSSTTPNTANTDVIHLGAASRTMILDNTFAGFGESTDKYANLIYINGVPSPGNPGGPGNSVRGNRAYGYGTSATFPDGSGAINGLYLDTDAPPTTEEDNAYSTNDANHTCANVNVSKYPQSINRAWATFSTSLFPLDPLPDRELPGFLSIHKVQRGTVALDFVADDKAVNNSQTVLKVDSIDGSYNIICWNLDLSRYVGNDPLTNLTVKIRMRLDSSAGGGDTDTVDAYLSEDPWPGSDAIVDSKDWKWYSFTIPMSGITDANHLLGVTLTAKDKALYVDGFEFSAD